MGHTINRVMASVEKIAEIRDIPNADMIQSYRVNGWWVVDKKDAYKVDDLVVYASIDSWIPHDLAPFLSKGKEPRQFNGVKGERLRTVKLRGTLSQGLLISFDKISEYINTTVCLNSGDDVSELLGIQKYEPPIPSQLAGDVEGKFPSTIMKTDQDRVQNIHIGDYLNDVYEVSEKLHGSSCTFYLDMDGKFHVCSRNYDLKYDENNSYWKVSLLYDVEQKMKDLGLLGYAIQGELCGIGINGNNYNLTLDFFVFEIQKEGVGSLTSNARLDIVNQMKLKHVPIVYHNYVLIDSIDELLVKADGKSYIANCKREGHVYKSITNPEKSFKVVSNQWLLKYE